MAEDSIFYHPDDETPMMYMGPRGIILYHYFISSDPKNKGMALGLSISEKDLKKLMEDVPGFDRNRPILPLPSKFGEYRAVVFPRVKLIGRIVNQSEDLLKIVEDAKKFKLIHLQDDQERHFMGYKPRQSK